jgi:hypothetical protein
MKTKIFISLLAIICTCSLHAQTIFARANGDWDQTTVWSTIGIGGASCGCVPGPGDDVLIDGYDVDIDAGTGSVTANSVRVSNSRGVRARFRLQGGITLTVTNDFEIENVSGAAINSLLGLTGTGTRLEVNGDFIIDQDNGDDILITVDDNGQVNVDGTLDCFQDGGDDIEINLNTISGTSAQFNVVGTMTFDHDGGDDIRLRTNGANSLFSTTEDVVVAMNAGLDDDFTFNLDAGDFNITGDLLLTRANTYGPIDIDLDGGDITCDNIVINSSGPLFTNGAVQFFVDQASQINCASLTSTYVGADDLFFHINQSAGTTAQINVANDFILDRSAGDDIEIRVSQNGQLNVGGDFTINSSGPDSEQLEIVLANNGIIDIDGNFAVLITNGENNAGNTHELTTLTGGSPLFHVGGNFSWESSIDLVVNDIDLNAGTIDVDGDFTVIQNAGAEDLIISVDGSTAVTIGGNMQISLNGGDDLSFNLGSIVAASTCSWTVAGNATLTHNNNSATSTFQHLVHQNSRFTVNGNLNLTHNFTAAPLFSQEIRTTAEVRVDGNVNLTALGAGDLEINQGNSSFFRIGGNFVRAASPNNFGSLVSSGTATVEYRGSIAQIIAQDDGAGADAFFYTNLEVDNTFGTIPQLTLEGIATVHGNLLMNDGVVASDATVILIVADGGTSTGASNASYVDGYMRKVGNDIFTFPSGDDGFYGPIGITAPATVSDQFEAEYIHSMPHLAGFDSTMRDPTLHHISKVEYWKLNRTAGASTPTVTLSWDTPRSGGVVDITDLRFARWDGGVWRDLGAAGLTGVAANGTLNNSVGITAFADNRPYTLATIDAINPLPIELLYFDAVLEDDGVHLSWETASEVNNDYFTIEKSVDGTNWEIFETVKGAGNSSFAIPYHRLDRKPYYGLSYYRLKQTDFDGKFEYFGPISIVNEPKFVVYPNPANDLVNIVSSFENLPLKVLNSLGEEIFVSVVAENGKLTFSTSELANGIYYIHYSNFVKQLVVVH